MRTLQRAGTPLRWVPAVVATTAAIHLAYALELAFRAEDVGPFETVLARAVASHFEPGVGPGRFYGPYGADHPSVLMHAPLYYRLTALVAWPWVAAGLDPLGCALGAGRAMAALGSALLLMLTWRLARRDGLCARAGWLAVGLLAGSPLFANLMVMVRPDSLGVAAQTGAAWLGLRAIEESEPRANRRRALVAAAVLAGLAFLLKQHHLTVASILTLLVARAWIRGVISAREVALAASAWVGTVVGLIAVEAFLTEGRMGRTVFEYPGGPFRHINYAGWVHVASVFDIVARRAVGLIGMGLLGALMVGRAAWLRTDRFYGLCLVVELAALVPLCLYNAGAASNYALQAVVFGSVLVARLLDRLMESPPAGWLGRWGSLGILGSALVLLGSGARWTIQAESLRTRDRTVARLIASNPVLPEARYFVAHQEWNRLYGRPDLIHDDWLYGAFEQIGEAEPRQRWLRAALTDGPVREVVTPRHVADRVPGLDEPLEALGYRQVAEVADYRIWRR
ncbi:MAG: hypothetical protein KatS3mg108_2910 [Isosphaeraceae bacterium]|jgi:hypothetical protein|nr:MAG: hypothetical protein KatS3mg108_2910 [Isosphaeraceae bacterium]